ncbi:MAG: type IV secretion system DNA-binding domain-containing protein [Rhizobiaceae bacterium]|nr:type IV secretion system DNA-binding domain-containing protein [Rhizobiaceae bacterium]
MSNEIDGFLSFVAGFMLLAALIAAFVFGLILIIPLGIAVSVGMVIYSHYSPNSKRNVEQAEIAETHQLYDQAKQISPITEDEFADFVEANFDDPQLRETAMILFRMEGYQAPSPPPPIVTGIEGGRYRDELKRFINIAHDRGDVESFKRELVDALKPFDATPSENGFFSARRYLNNDEIDDLARAFFGDHHHFKHLRTILDRNFNEQHCVLPSDYRGDNCPWDYLKDTPLLDLEFKHVEVEWENRAAHTLILAGSGAGKTTLFKHMIAKLLEEDCCVVVMDSQTQLIEELAHLELKEEDVTWISPEHQLALNPFDCDPADLKDEAIINNKVSLMKFVVEHLIEAEMTSKQDTLFHHCCHLVFAIPNANVQTFKDVLRDPFNYADVIDTLDETSQKFFNNELNRETGSKKRGIYDSTREELAYRLDGLTRQATFRRIFGTEENTFDFYEEVLERKLILLHTNRGLLSDDSRTFGRFFVAQALQACFQRLRTKKLDKPVYFFIDEAHELFDDKLEAMLLQARKAKVGMVLATQDLSRANKAGISDTLIGNTSTKIVSKVGMGDAKRVAPRMQCRADFLTSLPGYTFAFSSGDMDAVSIRADADPLSHLEKRTNLRALRKDMEYHYGPEFEDEEKPDQEQKSDPEETMSQNEDHDIEPSDTL